MTIAQPFSNKLFIYQIARAFVKMFRLRRNIFTRHHTQNDPRDLETESQVSTANSIFLVITGFIYLGFMQKPSAAQERLTENHLLLEIFESIDRMRGIWQGYATKEISPTEAASLLSIESKRSSPQLQPFALYLAFRAQIEHGLLASPIDLLPLIKHRAIAMDVLQAMAEIEFGNRHVYAKCFSMLLPTSRYSNHGEDIHVLVDIYPPGLPALNGEILLEIAAYFEQLSMFEYACYAYMEYLYAFRFHGWIRQKTPIGDNSGWLTSSNGLIHELIAKNAKKSGFEDLMYTHLAKAVIFGDRGSDAAAKIASLKLFSGDPEVPSVELPFQERDLLLSKIADLYISMNMHPRAISLIKEHETLMNNSFARILDIQSQWLGLIEAYKAIYPKIVLFGQEVWPNGDPMAIAAPWPSSDEAMAMAQEIIKNEFKESRMTPFPGSQHWSWGNAE